MNENGGWAGMAVIQVSNSTIRQNTLQNVTPYRFYYAPGLNLQPNLTFDTTNTADGQPVLYNEQKNGLIIDNSSNPAMVVLMSCTNTTVRNVSISDSGLGVGIYGGENNPCHRFSYCYIQHRVDANQVKWLNHNRELSFRYLDGNGNW